MTTNATCWLLLAGTVAHCFFAPRIASAIGTEGSGANAPPAKACRLHPRPSDATSAPPMGWNSWNHFQCSIDERAIRETADALVVTGMKAAGYDYLVIDDCWAASRKDGTVVADSRSFPSGIGELAAYIHGKGLKFGIYTDAGETTCAGRPGSFGYEQQDARTYARWGVDYVKEDWCHTDGLSPVRQYRAMRDALAATGRDIILGACNWGVQAPWVWGPEVATLWRTTNDIQASWNSVLANFDQNANLAQAARPGHFNDPDMLEVGQGLSVVESRAHFSLWALAAAPLLAGNDLRTMSPAIRDILTNREVIAVDQDALGVQGVLVRDLGDGLQVWSKPLSDCGSRAVVVLNRGATAQKVQLEWRDLALEPGPGRVRDLWAGRDLGSFDGTFSTEVAPHGTMMFRIEGSEVEMAGGESYLSDLSWLYGVSGWGPIERDSSNGEAAAGDGGPISIDGRTYSKGLGVHADSAILLSLGGRCDRFQADVGLDDEVGGRGLGVNFEIWGDGRRLFGSGPVTAASGAVPVSIDLHGVSSLWLSVNHLGDSADFDHADWAEARLHCE